MVGEQMEEDEDEEAGTNVLIPPHSLLGILCSVYFSRSHFTDRRCR